MTNDRVYVWEMYEDYEQDSGAHDEGFYYEWCSYCETRTEHEFDGTCLDCEY
jgi:hypothetical protein